MESATTTAGNSQEESQQSKEYNSVVSSQDCLTYDNDPEEQSVDILQSTDDVADNSNSLDFSQERPQESTEESDQPFGEIILPELKLEPDAYDDYDDNLDVLEDPEPGIDEGEGALLPGEVLQIKKRKSYANSFKLEAIKLAESIGNRKAAKSLGLDESNVREWRKRKQEIETLPSEKRTKRHAKPKWIDLEQTLAQWYLDRKSKDLYVTMNMVKEKGMELALQFGHEDFTGSSGWVTRFFSRLKDNSGGNFSNNVSDKQQPQHPSSLQISTIPPDCTERIQTFQQFFAEKRALFELRRRNGIISFDEIPIALDMPCSSDMSYSNRSVNQNHSSNSNPANNSVDLIIPPAEKLKFTVILSASAAGGKLSPLVIFKETGIIPKETLLAFPEGIIVRCNEKGWINPQIIEDWIEQSWKKWLWPMRSEENVLILDSCRTHTSPDIKFNFSKHFQLQYIPKGLSSVLHPLEIQVGKSFKESIFKQWENWILDRACGGIESVVSNLSRKVENYLTICNWIVEAWKDVNPNAIMNGFAKAGIESFTPEDIVEAILSEGRQNSNDGQNCQNSELSQTVLFPDQVNLIGDDFDGWDKI